MGNTSPNGGLRTLLSFDVDCGELLPGHRFVARGVREDGYSEDSVNCDYLGHYAG